MKNQRRSGSFGKAVGAIVLAAVFAVGGAVAGWYAHEQDWFGLAEKTEETKKDEANGMVVSGIEANGLEVAVAPLAATSVEDGKVVTDEAYTLTVTPDPADADDTYTWTATDTSSVTLSPSEDTKSCTVTCNQAFGTQITLTVTSTVTPEVTASATLDYLKAPMNVTITSPTTIAFSTSGTTYTVSATPTWGTGTLTPDTFTVTGGWISNDLDIPEEYSYMGVTRKVADVDLRLRPNGTLITTPSAAFVSYTFIMGGGGEIITKTINPDIEVPPVIYTEEQCLTQYENAFQSAVTGSNDGTLTVEYTYSYQGVQIASSSVEISVGFDVSAMSVNAVTIDPNADGVIFY